MNGSNVVGSGKEKYFALRMAKVAIIISAVIAGMTVAIISILALCKSYANVWSKGVVILPILCAIFAVAGTILLVCNVNRMAGLRRLELERERDGERWKHEESIAGITALCSSLKEYGVDKCKKNEVIEKLSEALKKVLDLT